MSEGGRIKGGGDKNGAVPGFLTEVRALLADSERSFEKRQKRDGARGVFATAAAGSLKGLRSELDEFETRYPEEGETVGIAQNVLATTDATRMIAAQRNVAAEEPTEGGHSEALGMGLEIGELVFEKIGAWLEEGPWKSLVEDIADVLGFFANYLKGEERRRMEQKLESLQVSINGLPFPPGEIEGPWPGSGPSIRAAVEELEAKIEQFYTIVVGRDVARTPDGRIEPPPAGRAPRPQVRDSVLWVAWELERKLENVFTQLVGNDFPRNTEGDVIEGIISPRDSVGGGIRELRIKIDTLAKLLGKTLYDADWNVEPDDNGRTRTVAQAQRAENRTPPRSVKDELHDLERLLHEAIRLLWWIIGLLRVPHGHTPPEHPPTPPGPGSPVPPETTPPLPGDLKRIFVYDEGVFSPTASVSSKTIPVRTGAFDLGGWIDLSELSDGDTVEIGLHVHLPGHVRRLYRHSTFSDRSAAGLLRIADVIGPGFLMGNAVDLTITQTASSNGFVPPLAIAYQVVVESQ